LKLVTSQLPITDHRSLITLFKEVVVQMDNYVAVTENSLIVVFRKEGDML